MKSEVVLTIILPLLESDTVETTCPCIPLLLKVVLIKLRVFNKLKELACTFRDYKRVHLLVRADLASPEFLYSWRLEFKSLVLVLEVLPLVPVLLPFLDTSVQVCGAELKVSADFAVLAYKVSLLE